MINLKNRLKQKFFSRINLQIHYDYLHEKWNKKSTHIFIACLPKSGSTFLANTLVNITEFKFKQYQPHRSLTEHDIRVDYFLSSINKNTLTQLHSRPNENNYNIFKNYNIKVVFLYRNITDSLISIRNHILNESNQWFMFTAAKDFDQWPIEKQFDFLIDLVVPWYINFLISWEKEIIKGDIDILKIDYDDFNKDNFTTIKSILNFYKLSKFEDKIDRNVQLSLKEKEKYRYNKHKNSPKYKFNDEQIDRIQGFLSYYPEFKIKI